MIPQAMCQRMAHHTRRYNSSAAPQRAGVLKAGKLSRSLLPLDRRSRVAASPCASLPKRRALTGSDQISNAASSRGRDRIRSDDRPRPGGVAKQLPRPDARLRPGMPRAHDRSPWRRPSSRGGIGTTAGAGAEGERTCAASPRTAFSITCSGNTSRASWRRPGSGDGLAAFVERELRAFLFCGVLAAFRPNARKRFPPGRRRGRGRASRSSSTSRTIDGMRGACPPSGRGRCVRSVCPPVRAPRRCRQRLPRTGATRAAPAHLPRRPGVV